MRTSWVGLRSTVMHGSVKLGSSHVMFLFWRFRNLNLGTAVGRSQSKCQTLRLPADERAPQATKQQTQRPGNRLTPSALLPCHSSPLLFVLLLFHLFLHHSPYQLNCHCANKDPRRMRQLPTSTSTSRPYLSTPWPVHERARKLANPLDPSLITTQDFFD